MSEHKWVPKVGEQVRVKNSPENLRTLVMDSGELRAMHPGGRIDKTPLSSYEPIPAPAAAGEACGLVSNSGESCNAAKGHTGTHWPTADKPTRPKGEEKTCVKCGGEYVANIIGHGPMCMPCIETLQEAGLTEADEAALKACCVKFYRVLEHETRCELFPYTTMSDRLGSRLGGKKRRRDLRASKRLTALSAGFFAFDDAPECPFGQAAYHSAFGRCLQCTNEWKRRV